MNTFKFYLPGMTTTKFLLFIGEELGFYRPDAIPKPIQKTGVIYREFAYNNSVTVEHALSYRDDWTAGASNEKPEALRIALFYGVKDRTGTHQAKHVNYCYIMVRDEGHELSVSGYHDNPKEITWDEDETLIPLPDGFPEKEIAGLFEKIVSRWPEAIWSEGKPEFTTEACGVPIWELVPDRLWDRRAVEMWVNNSTSKEIGKAVGVSEESVRNRLSELRKRGYPIPTNGDRRKIGYVR